MQLNILVTGGAGFIGSNLVGRLLDMGHTVTVLDSLITGSLNNLSAYQSNINFKFIQADVINPMIVGPIDQIYHMACPASPKHYQSDPILTTKTCVLGAINIAELAIENRCRVLNASTSEVYGEPQIHPQIESYWGNVNPNGIRSCYDEGKRCAESIFMDYYRKHRLDVVQARIFNTYGPQMDHDDGRVVPNFIAQALNDQSFTIYGDGKQTRSFCFVDDLVDGLIALMNSVHVDALPYNLGNPVENTMIELAKVVLELTGSQSEFNYTDLPSDDPTRRLPDITRSKTTFGFDPKTTLKDGLSKTIAYFSNQLCNV